MIGTVVDQPVAADDNRSLRLNSYPETLHASCDVLIFVEQSADPVAPLGGVRLARRRPGEWL
jgi:hypothetical protein